MSQSSIIAAALLAGFVLFLAAQDRLKVYASVLWGATEAPLPNQQQSGATTLPAASSPGVAPATTALLDSNPFGNLLSDTGPIAGLLDFIP